MAQISNIMLPNNTKYDLKGSIHTVIGTQTAAGASWTGELKTIDALYDGLTIAYWLPYAGASNVTLNLTLKSGTTGAINCYYQGNSRLTTHYGAGSMILLTYWSAGKIKVNGTATTDNRWVAGQNYVDGNTVPTIYCGTGAGTAAKTTSSYSTEAWNSGTVKDQTKPCYLIVDMYYNNTATSALTFAASNWPAKPIWINGTASSASNHTLPKGMYIVYYDGSVFHFRTDGILPTGGINISNKVNLEYNSTTEALDFIFS